MADPTTTATSGATTAAAAASTGAVTDTAATTDQTAAAGAAAATTDAAAGSSAEPLDAAAATHELDQARREAAKARGELKKLQEAQKLADEAKMSEEEKRTTRLAEVEKLLVEKDQALRERTSYASVVDAAARLGAAKPAMIHRLIASDIEFDDAGEPKNVDALIKDFLKTNPEFTSTAGRPTGDAGQGARGKSSLTVAEIRKMTPEEINARWPEVSGVLGQGGS